ncbi:MAG TPA: DNA cytosine methyltransferase [Baekduia sp.]|nr:DNA cytosine methyltransferase [Baekduia sp.]
MIDLFAGPGGWDVGARALGLDPLGVEWDDAACQTREAAGLRTIQGDVAALEPQEILYETIDANALWGLIASPPCQAWSMAGKGGGRRDQEHVIACAHEQAQGWDTRSWRRAECEDERSMLVVEPLRWVRQLKPTWVAFEQVPPVLGLWAMFAQIMEAEWGYQCWTGVLEAERYGVPQTRERAVLIARRDRPVHPPTPTHQRYVPGEPQRHDVTLEGEILPWVSMAEALGWSADDRVGFPRRADNGRATDDGYRARDFRDGSEPAFNLTEKARSVTRMRANTRTNATVRAADEPPPTITAGHDSGERVWLRAGTNANDVKRQAAEPAPTLRFGERSNAVDWVSTRPAPTVTGDARGLPEPKYRKGDERQWNENAVRVTVQEAAVLQSFPPDYPWDGLRTAPHVAPGRAVKDDDAVLDELVGELQQSAVHFTVLGVGGEHSEVVQAVVVPNSVDVVHDLARLRVGDVTVLRHNGLAGEQDVPGAVESRPGGEAFGAIAVRLERITVEPPLLPVLGAEVARNGFAFAVKARWLRGVDEGIGGAPVADVLVVHQAQALRSVLPVATFDVACAHRSTVPCRPAGNSRSKQFQQVGNAVPPLLAMHVLSAVTGLEIPTREEVADAA